MPESVRSGLPSSMITWVILWLVWAILAALISPGIGLLGLALATGESDGGILKPEGGILGMAALSLGGGFVSFAIICLCPLARIPHSPGYIPSPQEQKAARATIIGLFLGFLLYYAIYMVLCHGLALLVMLVTGEWKGMIPFDNLVVGLIVIGVLDGTVSAIVSRNLAEKAWAGTLFRQRMRRFRYEGIDPSRTPYAGVLEARNEDEAKEQIKKLGLFLVQLQEVQG